jgi:Tfp pilus assembly protein PilF
MTRPLPLAALAVLLAAAAARPQPPTLPAADEQKAIEQFRGGRLDDALETLKLAANANPQLPPARVLFADLFFKSGNSGRARQELEKAAAEDPAHPDVLALNGTYAMNEGRLTDAVLSFEAALKGADSPRWTAAQQKRFVRAARLGLAQAYQARGDYKAARGQLVAALADDPKNGPLRQQAAVAAFLAGSPDVAQTELAAAYADDKTVDPPELILARLWSGKREQAQAEDWFKKAVAAHPQSGKAARGYAEWLLDRGRSADAGPYLEAAAKLDPTAPETAALLGMAARYRKDWAAAEKIFEGLSRDAPGNPFYGWNLALVLAEQDDPKKRDRAVQLAEAVRRQYPREAEGMAVLGWCLFRAGRTDEAAQAFQQRTNAGAFGADTAFFIAKLLEARNQPAEAQRLLREAVAQTGPFVYRKDAEGLLAELDKRFPPKKDEKKP